MYSAELLTQNWLDANMLKVESLIAIDFVISNTYAGEIQTEECGEGLAERQDIAE